MSAGEAVGLIGIAMRAGKLTLGEEACLNVIRADRAALILIDEGVSPKRNEISFEQWVEMDIDYILHRSVWMDISIIFRTVYVMLCGEGR